MAATCLLCLSVLNPYNIYSVHRAGAQFITPSASNVNSMLQDGVSAFARVVLIVDESGSEDETDHYGLRNKIGQHILHNIATETTSHVALVEYGFDPQVNGGIINFPVATDAEAVDGLASDLNNISPHSETDSYITALTSAANIISADQSLTEHQLVVFISDGSFLTLNGGFPTEDQFCSLVKPMSKLSGSPNTFFFLAVSKKGDEDVETVKNKAIKDRCFDKSEYMRTYPDGDNLDDIDINNVDHLVHKAIGVTPSPMPLNRPILIPPFMENLVVNSYLLKTDNQTTVYYTNGTQPYRSFDGKGDGFRHIEDNFSSDYVITPNLATPSWLLVCDTNPQSDDITWLSKTLSITPIPNPTQVNQFQTFNPDLAISTTTGLLSGAVDAYAKPYVSLIVTTSQLGQVYTPTAEGSSYRMLDTFPDTSVTGAHDLNVFVSAKYNEPTPPPTDNLPGCNQVGNPWLPSDERLSQAVVSYTVNPADFSIGLTSPSTDTHAVTEVMTPELTISETQGSRAIADQVAKTLSYTMVLTEVKSGKANNYPMTFSTIGYPATERFVASPITLTDGTYLVGLAITGQGSQRLYATQAAEKVNVSSVTINIDQPTPDGVYERSVASWNPLEWLNGSPRPLVVTISLSYLNHPVDASKVLTDPCASISVKVIANQAAIPTDSYLCNMVDGKPTVYISSSLLTDDSYTYTLEASLDGDTKAGFMPSHVISKISSPVKSEGDDMIKWTRVFFWCLIVALLVFVGWLIWYNIITAPRGELRYSIPGKEGLPSIELNRFNHVFKMRGKQLVAKGIKNIQSLEIRRRAGKQNDIEIRVIKDLHKRGAGVEQRPQIDNTRQNEQSQTNPEASEPPKWEQFTDATYDSGEVTFTYVKGETYKKEAADNGL